jgi:arylsulfatase A
MFPPRFFLLFSCLWLLPGLHASAQTTVAKPNIILIMADDFGYEGVTANGGESYKTPTLDRLAAEGVRFEQCHAQPLCTPTRVQLMTGLYNVRNYTDFGKLRREETTFAQLLKKEGYATGVFGKWQLGKEKDSAQHFGFEESVLWQQTRIREKRAARYANPGLEFNGVERNFTEGEYGPKVLNNAVLDFITRHQEHPFFLYYPMVLPHDPFQPTPDSENWDPTLTGDTANSKAKHFPDMVAYMDKMIGRVIDKLDELKMRENTLVIFLGDNGTHSSITSRFKGQDYRGGKNTTTARGTRVPLIASWPKIIKQGRVCGDLISTVDFLPTLCVAAGIPTPAKTDGISFLPQFRGESGTPREWLYCWYLAEPRPGKAAQEYAATAEHKLYRDGRFFDLTKDPFEKQPLQPSDLSVEMKAVAEKLVAVLDQFKDARPAELR